MGTPLDTGAGSSGPPAIKLPNIGDWVRFAVVDVDNDVPVYKYGSNPRVLDTKADGTPKKQIRLTVLPIAAEGAVTGNLKTGETSPVTIGELATIYIDSYMKWDPDQDKLDKQHKSWSACTEAVGLGVGYVGEWKFLGELPSAAEDPRKDRKFRLRADKPEEAEQQQRCEKLRRELQERTTFSEPAESQPPAYAGASADEF
jgi:hypothetical protein